MRIPLSIGLSAAVLALAATSHAKPRPDARPQAARSAERAGAPASYRSDAGHGYSARERRMLACLASDSRYDPASDRIVVRPGVSRPCEINSAGS